VVNSGSRPKERRASRRAQLGFWKRRAGYFSRDFGAFRRFLRLNAGFDSLKAV
jgi:hypothetical protein